MAAKDWRLSTEFELQSGRAIQVNHRERENLNHPQYGVPRWNYETSSHSVVALQQVENATYHSSRALRMYASTPLVTSWIHCYEVKHGKFAEPRLAHCRLGTAGFYVESLEQLWQELRAKKDCVLVVEDMLPPVIEIIGQSWTIPAQFFQAHVGSAWGLPRRLELGRSVPNMLQIYQPVLFAAKKDIPHAERRSVLTLLATHYQDNRMWELVGCQWCVAFEHVTVLYMGGRMVVALPPTNSGDTSRSKEIQHDLAPGPSWIRALETASAAGTNMQDVPRVAQILCEQALGAWANHLVHISRAIEIIDEDNVEAHQAIRSLLVKDLSLLSEMTGMVHALDAHVDFESIQHALERLLPTLQHRIDILVTERQSELARLQLEESRKAIQQADTIKRLTILAFIYIPIQTASSIFGMNVSELRDFPSVWTFAVLAVGLLFATVLASVWHDISARFNSQSIIQ